MMEDILQPSRYSGTPTPLWKITSTVSIYKIDYSKAVTGKYLINIVLNFIFVLKYMKTLTINCSYLLLSFPANLSLLLLSVVDGHLLSFLSYAYIFYVDVSFRKILLSFSVIGYKTCTLFWHSVLVLWDHMAVVEHMLCYFKSCGSVSIYFSVHQCKMWPQMQVAWPLLHLCDLTAHASAIFVIGKGGKEEAEFWICLWEHTRHRIYKTQITFIKFTY